MKSDAPRTPAVQVLARAFAVLDLLALHKEPLSLKTISEHTSLHQAAKAGLNRI